MKSKNPSILQIILVILACCLFVFLVIARVSIYTMMKEAERKAKSERMSRRWEEMRNEYRIRGQMLLQEHQQRQR